MIKQVDGQISLFDQGTWCGKTSPEHSAVTKDKTFKPSLKKQRRSQTKTPLFLDLRGGSKWTPSGSILADGWSIAWRVHDAQFWGVPQRRKRIALVADFGGQSAPEILFEREGLSGNIEKGGETRQGTATDTERRTDEAGKSCLNPWDVQSKRIQPQDGIADALYSGEKRYGGGESYVMTDGQPTSWTLKIRGGVERDSYGKKAGKGALVQTELSATLGVSQDQTLICLNDQGGSQMNVSQDVTGALRAQEHGHQPIVYGISAYESNSMKSANPHSGVYEADTSRTLDNNGGNPACNQGGMAVVYRGDSITSPVNASNPKVGDPSHTLTADDRNYVVCIEGNGTRESHKGDGYKESETMYTLNTVEQHAVCVENHPADSRVKIREDNVCQTLSSRMGTGGGNVPMVMETYQKTTGTLSPGAHAGSYNGQDAYNDMLVVDKQITYGLDRASYNQGENAKFGFPIDEELVGAQTAKGHGAVCNSVVRRLTPLECTRLQGYPDGWVDIGEWIDSKGKKRKDSDSPKYKALGNSIALPFWEWMAGRIVEQLRKDGTENPTMASLFDGIGGFPLVFSWHGCKPVWASEIEEFPMAVTKIRFPDEDEIPQEE